MHEVVILGAGMAGMACARTLLRRGCRPLLVAPVQDTANRGETLSFRASPHLERLGWLGLLDTETAIACQGRYSIWGSATLRRDSLHQESESGWHIDRQQLERRMAKLLDADEVARHHSKALRLSQTPAHVVVDLADSSSIEAAFVVDCSGRASVTADRATPMRRLDKLVACYVIFELERDVEAMPATLVEAVAAGWWYMSVMPGHRILLCFFTDSDLLPAGLRQDMTQWTDMISHTDAISARVASLGIDPAACPRLQFAPASTTTMSKLIDHRIVRAGDAASALDPLGANGLATALWSGIQAAETVTGALVQDNTASRHYERQFLEGIASYLITQRAIYASEHRFPSAPFWQRRNDAPLESTSSSVET